METGTAEEVRKIASQIEARKIPPPNRAQSLVLIRQMVLMAEQLEGMREELKNVGAMVPCATGGTFVNDPPDAIVDALARHMNELTYDALRYRWLREQTNECADACGTFLDFPRVDCHTAPNLGDIDAAIDIAMSNA